MISGVGPFTERLLKIFPKNVEISDAFSGYENLNNIELLGMNPKCVFMTESMLEAFRQDVCTRLKIYPSQQSKKVLLIERIPPDEYFFTQAAVQGGGASWRSIINHAELRSTISSMVKEPFEFHNLQLENIPFEEQIRYFSEANIVIAQHGAGLTNCIWMKSKAFVVELGHDEVDNHFRTLSGLHGLHYYWYKTNSNHATIDIDDFVEWLLSKPSMGQYFQSKSTVLLNH